MRQQALTATLWLALLVLGLAVVAQQRVHSFTESQNTRLALLVERRLVAERWLGAQLPEDLRSLVDGAQARRVPLLLWAVDLDRCGDCTYDVAHWNALARTSLLRQAVLLSGGTPGRQEVFRQLLDPWTPVQSVSAGEIERLFHFSFSSIRVLSDEAGVIRSVDWRRPDSRCRWSYPAFVAGMLGLDVDLPYQVGDRDAADFDD